MRCAYFSIAGIPERSGTSNVQPLQRDQRLGLRLPIFRFVLPLRKALRQMHEPFFEFAAKNRRDAQRPQILHIHRRIEAVTAEMRARILLAQAKE